MQGGTPSPESDEGKALAELEKEGHVVDGREPAKEPVVDPVPPAKVEDKKPDGAPVDPVKPAAAVDPKPNRPVTMVEAWKLKVAEDQKGKLESDFKTVTAELEKLKAQGKPATQAQADEIQAEIKAIADKAGIDPAPLSELADAILKRTKPSTEITETVKKLNDEREAAHHENLYSQDFEKNVLPLVKAQFPTLPDTAISEIKTKLKDYAFSENYAKVPLAELFAAKQSVLDIQVPKKSSEGKGPKVRANDVVDMNNLSEEDFSKMSPEKVAEFEARNSTGSWKSPKK